MSLLPVFIALPQETARQEKGPPASGQPHCINLFIQYARHPAIPLSGNRNKNNRMR